jgi:pyrimidine-nucleoside phosphorylase
VNMLRLIETKRDGGRHGAEELAWLVRGVVDESLPDYQLAAWLMAVVCRGLDDQETADLTLAMAHSGVVLDLSDLPGPVVDKHSTGGVGDKTSLVVVPLAAATGLTVAKMSGRGLGFTGGTLDKLESIPGLTVDLSIERFKRQAAEVGCVIAGQSAGLAPADKRLYALRDVTGTVPSLPLIAASVMSKKIAAGAGAIVLDVKVGRGAFMTTPAEARALAQAMVRLGRHAGRRVIACLAAMDQPLGSAVGNALEVKEAIDTLHGRGPGDLVEHCLTIAGWLHVAAGRAAAPGAVRPALEAALSTGAAAAKLAALIAAQGGDARVVDDTSRLPSAPVIGPTLSDQSGYIVALDALAVARAAVDLGAGRQRKGDPVDPAVGVELALKVGDEVGAGDVLALVHARTPEAAEAAATAVRAAYRIAPRPVRPPELISEVVS